MSKSFRLQKHVHPCSHKYVRNKTENAPIGCRVRGRSDTKKAIETATATGTAASVDCGRSDRSGRSRGDASSRAAVRTRRQRRQRRWWWRRRQPRRRRRRRWWRRRRRRCRRRRRRWRWRRHLHCTQETQTQSSVSEGGKGVSSRHPGCCSPIESCEEDVHVKW